MKKRVREKTTKKNNIAKHAYILDKINSKYEVCNKRFLDGYFKFGFEKATVCHFEIEDIPDWKFAIWLGDCFELLSDDTENPTQIFCEYKDFIDKFKPSHGYNTQEIRCDKDIDSYIDFIEEIVENENKHIFMSGYYFDEETDKWNQKLADDCVHKLKRKKIKEK